MSRVSWMYAGWMEQGNFAQWPTVNFCSEEYDPRFRPWFANAATGPKDVFIVIDSSGSMNE